MSKTTPEKRGEQIAEAFGAGPVTKSTANNSQREELWKALSEAAGIDTSAMVSKIKTAPSSTKGKLTQELNQKIISAIKKQFGDKMSEAVKPILAEPEAAMNRYLPPKDNIMLLSIQNLQNSLIIQQAADQAIDRIYKVTGTKKPKDGQDLTKIDESLAAAIDTKLGKNPEVAQKYKALLENACEGKKTVNSTRDTVMTVLGDTGVVIQGCKQLDNTKAAELKKGLSEANAAKYEHWKTKNPKQAMMSEALGKVTIKFLNKFRKSVSSTKDTPGITSSSVFTARAKTENRGRGGSV